MQSKYEVLGVVGEGAYGIVYKCKKKDTGKYVAIKKFKETDDDLVKKTMKRELRMLQQLRHPNIVDFREAFKRKGNLFLVFEFVDRNLLELLQTKPNGLEPNLICHLMFQLCKAISYLHSQEVIHRDIKPENLLVDNDMNLKLCDFGFARKVLKGQNGLTDYVATRWYRSPELLLTNGVYGPGVDYWAVGCIMGELTDGNPMFPGEDETDQLICIEKVLGNLPQEQVNMFYSNPIYNGKVLKSINKPETLERRYMGKLSKVAISFMKGLLEMDPKKRLNGDTVFKHPYFKQYMEEKGIEMEKDKEKEKEKEKGPIKEKVNSNNHTNLNTNNNTISNNNNINITNSPKQIKIKKESKKENEINNNNVNSNNNHNNNTNLNQNNQKNITTINTTNINIINVNSFNGVGENNKVNPNQSINFVPLKNPQNQNKASITTITFNNTLGTFKSNQNQNQNNKFKKKEKNFMNNSSNNGGVYFNNKFKQNKKQNSFKDIEMFKTYYNNNNKNDIYNFNINTQFGSQRFNYKSQNKNNNIIYEDVEYPEYYNNIASQKNKFTNINYNKHIKNKTNNIGFGSHSMYGNFGKKNNKIALPTLAFSKKGF